MENVGSIDLRDGRWAQWINNKNIGVSPATDHSEARTQTIRLANNELYEIAMKAVELDNEYGRPLPLPDTSLFGGALRDRAKNTRINLLANGGLSYSESPQTQSFFQNSTTTFGEKMYRWLYCNDNDINSLLKDDELILLAEMMGKQYEKKHVFTIIPENKNTNIAIYEAAINSAVYDSYSRFNDEFRGIKLTGFEIPHQYKTFVETYLNNGKLSGSEEEKFVATVKALETINAFNKKQQKGSANTEKEDVDIFDLSGDGFLNRGDISALELFIKRGTDKSFAEKLDTLGKEDWDSLKTLRTVSGLTDKKTKDLFDLDGDGNVNEKDYQLYSTMFKKPEKFDINGDYRVDSKDLKLLKEYFSAILQRAKEDQQFRKNTEKIVGTKQQMAHLQRKVSEM